MQMIVFPKCQAMPLIMKKLCAKNESKPSHQITEIKPSNLHGVFLFIYFNLSNNESSNHHDTCCSSWIWCCLSTCGTWTQLCKLRETGHQHTLSPRTPRHKRGPRRQADPQSPPERTGQKVWTRMTLFHYYQTNKWLVLICLAFSIANIFNKE